MEMKVRKSVIKTVVRIKKLYKKSWMRKEREHTNDESKVRNTKQDQVQGMFSVTNSNL